MKKGVWPIIFSVIFLAGCQSSRFMRDDMYFTSYDAIREVRQFDVAQKEKEQSANKKENRTEEEQVYVPTSTIVEDYYDFSYTARIRRFNDPNNSWAYYDPYYTNYYWFNNSNAQYFGNSVYSTYSWWGNNIGANYNSNYWVSNTAQFSTKKNWINPWSNSWANSGWRNPYNKFMFTAWNRPNQSTISWNNNFCFNNMYYNSKDNNCYWWWSADGNAPGHLRKGNFALLMQRNGVKNDVIKRPDINYTQIKADYEKSIAQANAKDTLQNTTTVDNTNGNSSLASKNKNSRNTDKNTNSSNNTSNNTSNTSKRWDNYNADVNISPNTNNNTNNNWSRSGVFSEGSRNNNYEFKGTVIQKKKPNDSQEGSQTFEKDPKNK